MKLQQLRFFQAACKYNSITKAARELHISQPSISAAIHNLEAEFSVKLIERKYQGFELTKEGQVFLDLADGMIKHADKVEQRMLSISSSREPILIGVSPMAGITILPELYSSFLSSHTTILLSTEENGTKLMLQKLRENTLNIAFVSHYESLPAGFASITVMTTETMWCTMSDHPLAKRKFLRIEDLKDEKLVLFKNSFLLHDVVYNRFKEAGIRPNVLHETGHLTMIYALLKKQLATGFLMHSVAGYFPDLTLVPIRPPLLATISLVWLPQHNMSSDTKLLIDYYKNKMTFE